MQIKKFFFISLLLLIFSISVIILFKLFLIQNKPKNPHFASSASVKKQIITTPKPKPALENNPNISSSFVITTPTPDIIDSTNSPIPNTTINYTIADDWGDGAIINVTITNNSSVEINNWSISWIFENNQKISHMWNAKYTQIDKNIIVTNDSWNARIPPKSTLEFGFGLVYWGINKIPIDIELK